MKDIMSKMSKICFLCLDDIRKPSGDSFPYFRKQKEHTVIVVDRHAVTGGPLEGIVGIELDGTYAQPLLGDLSTQVFYGMILTVRKILSNRILCCRLMMSRYSPDA